jgi:ubiquitin carboxyl-terminal hydrolase 36/42
LIYWSTKMGKNAKKRRREQRRKEQQQQQQSSSSSRDDHLRKAQVAAAVVVPTTNGQQPPPTSAWKKSTFRNDNNVQDLNRRSDDNDESAAFAKKRKRTLAKISFVYPKHEDPIASERRKYIFGMESTVTATAASIIINHSLSHKTQTIDDILYPKPPSIQNDDWKKQPKDHQLSNISTRKDSALTTQEIISTSKSIIPVVTASSDNNDNHDNGDEEDVHAQSIRRDYLSGISVQQALSDRMGLRPRSNSTDFELNLPQRGLCDERKVLQNHQWLQTMNPPSTTTPCGFHNLGNTCFLNSTLQCLAYCPPFCQSLLNMSCEKKKQSFQQQSQSKNHGKTWTYLLGSLFQKIHNTEPPPLNGMTASRTLSPRNVVNSLPTLGRIGHKFRPGRQEDAHEFLVHLLDAMHVGELREAGIPQSSGWRDRLPVPRIDETTFIHRVFGGYFRSQVRCTECGYRSNKYDPFLDLSLEISRQSCHNIASALQEFTRRETLDSNNQWKCSGCKRRVCATKQLTVFRPPLALIVQLKRFSFGGTSFGGFGGGFGFGKKLGRKITKPIAFPANLDLPLSDGRSCGYALVGVVIHVGGSASSGHYTACVKKPGRDGKDRWFHVDDSYVQAVTEQEVLRQRDAYMLVYVRREVKLEFPTPPLRGSMTVDEATKFGRVRAKARANSIECFSRPTINEQESNGMAPVVENKKMHRVESNSSQSQIVIKSTNSTKKGQADTQNVTKAATTQARKETTSATEHNHKNSPQTSVGILPINELLIREQPEQQKLGTVNTKQVTTKHTESLKYQETCSSSSKSVSDEESESASSDDESSRALSTDKSSGQGFQKEVPGMVANEGTRNDESAGQSVRGSAKKELTRITVDRGSGGKVSVMMGPRYKAKMKLWKPKTAVVGAKDEGFDLLGNLHVSKWDEDDMEQNNSKEVTGMKVERDNIAKQMNRDEKKRKRKMFLDRHDAMLDKGKVG